MGSQLRFSDPEYINWIRDTLALIYLKEGIVKVVTTEATNFHINLQKAIGVYGAVSPSCTSCTARDIPNSFRGQWRMNCPLCHPWLVKIVQNHRDQPCPNIQRNNTDPQQWPAKPWEVLKCYMGFGCQSIQSAKDADAQNILTMFKKCLHFSRCGRLGALNLVDDLLGIRNSLFHSGDYLVADTKLDNDIQTMLDFLTGLTALSSDESQAVQESEDKIKELRTNRVDLSIYPDREIRALKAKQLALETKLQQDINTSNVHVNALQREIQDILQRITTVEAKTAKNEDEIKSLKADVGAVKDEQHKTTEDLKSVQKNLAHLETRMHKDRQQQTPSKEVLDANLRTTLMGVYKKEMQRIPIYLIEPDWTHPVEDLYAKQKLKRVDPRGKPEHLDNPDKNKPTKGDDKNIDKVTDILFKDGKVCKDVYVTSEAGYGKTTLCAHLVRLWCDAHSKSDANLSSANPDFEKDIQSMKTFSLLFYVNLSGEETKETKEQNEVALLIHTKLRLSVLGYSIADIERCLTYASTLVLMDSLDEMMTTKLPARGLHNNSCIVTTSRPWKLAAVRPSLQNTADYQQVDIVGLTESSPTDLVKNVLKILNKTYTNKNKNKGDDFLQDVQYAGLKDVLANPVLILHMLCLWFDDIPFGSSQTDIYSNVVHHQILTTIKNKKKIPEYERKSEKGFPLLCIKEYCECKKYGELLWKVASLAFSTLFCELVYDHEITPGGNEIAIRKTIASIGTELSKEEVEICLAMGFLTQHRLFGNQVTVKKISVSFPHKTNQEYFSAVFLSYKWQESTIFSVIKDLDRALELDKVLLFCSQLNPDVARELSRLISVRADDDARVQEYRQSGKNDDAPNIDLIYKIQNIVSAAQQKTIKISSPHPNSPSQQFAETSASVPDPRSGSTPRLIMADVMLCKPRQEWRRSEKDRIVNVAALDMAEIKSLHADAETADVTIWKMLEKETRCLQTLVFEGNKINVELIHGVVVRNKATLQTLGLHGASMFSRLDLSPLGNKLTDMFTPHLTCLLLHEVDLTHKQCEMLGRHLSTTDNIRRLALLGTSFSHEQCETLVRHLSATQNLQQLSLEFITCQTHGWSSGECCDVKLQSRLEHVKLCVLPFRMITFPAENLKTCWIVLEYNIPAATSALSCLTSASNLSNLREFTCWGLRDVASVQKLVAVLPRLHGLQRIVLSIIDFGSLREIRLSAAAETLEYVALWGSTITADGLESLVQSVNARRVMIDLDDVTITDRDPRDFLQRLRDSPDTEVMGDTGVKYKDGSGGEAAGWRVEKFMIYKNKQQTS